MYPAQAAQAEYELMFVLFVCAGLRLNIAWVSVTVLRPFLQPESPLSS